MTHARPARFIHRSIEELASIERPPDICEQAFELVAGQNLPKRTVAALARMVPARQIAAVRTMVAVNNLSGDFARALLAATAADERTDDARGRQSHPGCVIRLSRMERGLIKMQSTGEELRSRYGEDLAYLALVACFVRSWTTHEMVAAWLRSRHPKSATILDSLTRAADFAVKPGRAMKLPYSPTTCATESGKGRKRRR